MKKVKHFSVLLTFTLIFLQYGLSAQSSSGAKLWTTDDPFRSNVFVENSGQFDNWVATSEPVKYVINKGYTVFFTQQGLIIKVRKADAVSEKEREKLERKASKEITTFSKSYTISMNWQGCNANAAIEASEQTGGYYTSGEKGYASLKARGYKKLLYKDIYPGIDVEYTIPAASTQLSNQGGIKYSLIVHPGADISKVKMKYSGDIDKIEAGSDGSITIKTAAGDIVDHAPLSYVSETNDTIQSAFELNDNIVSFTLSKPPSSIADPHTIIIDPLLIIPTFLVNDYAAYDISFDDYGNIYVSGGTYLFKLAKYSPSGSFLWGFTNPAGWSPGWSCYSRFCLLPHSGTVFIGEAADPVGPRVMKLNSSGTLIYTTPNLTGNEEIWVMFYNRCTGQLAGFGGGTQLPNNLQLIADTNLSGSTIKNFNNSPDPRNDIASVEMDYDGDFYALMSSQLSVSNHLMKSLVSTGYSAPAAFDVYTGYQFYETGNSGIPGFSPNNVSTRANALALNNNYLFTYDGCTIKAWNKSSGAQLGSVVVNAGYGGGQYRTHEGIAVDDCNRVYVGGFKTVHVYTFDGAGFTAAACISASIADEVYDVRINKVTNTLYIAGLGFVVVAPATVCNTGNVLSISHTIDNCFGNAAVTVNGGTIPYTYLWSNGATTDNVSNLSSGTYIVTVSDNSCIQEHITDTIVIARDVVVHLSGDTVICQGSSTQLTATGAISYVWSPSTGLSTTSGSVVNASPPDTIMYTVNGTANGCPGVDSIKIYVKPRPEAFLGNDTLVCGVPFITLNAANPGFTYQWSTGANTQTINVDMSGTYSVTIDSLHCSGADTINVHFVPPPVVDLGPDTTICPGQSVMLDAQNPGASFLWSTGETTQSISAGSAGNYWVIVKISSCTDADTMRLHVVPNIDLGRDQSLCFQPQDTLGTDINADWYLWSTGETTPQIVVSLAGTYALSVLYQNCVLKDSVRVWGGFISLYVPNAFTPNGNGLNDNFMPYGEGITAINMKIFTRWGELIFETSDMNAGWDGTYKGKKAQMDAYIWVITYQTVCDGNWNLQRRGCVTLVR